jgi:hypothetical protein
MDISLSKKEKIAFNLYCTEHVVASIFSRDYFDLARKYPCDEDAPGNGIVCVGEKAVPLTMILELAVMGGIPIESLENLDIYNYCSKCGCYLESDFLINEIKRVNCWYYLNYGKSKSYIEKVKNTLIKRIKNRTKYLLPPEAGNVGISC